MKIRNGDLENDILFKGQFSDMAWLNDNNYNPKQNQKDECRLSQVVSTRFELRFSSYRQIQMLQAHWNVDRLSLYR